MNRLTGRGDEDGRPHGQDHQQRNCEEDGDGRSGAGDERGLDEKGLGFGGDEQGRDVPQRRSRGSVQGGEAHHLTGAKLVLIQPQPERSVEQQYGKEQPRKAREPGRRARGGEAADEDRAPQCVGACQERQRELDGSGPLARGPVIVFVRGGDEVEKQQLRELRRSDGLLALVAQTGKSPFAHRLSSPDNEPSAPSDPVGEF
jgi:hypothetical protein